MDFRERPTLRARVDGLATLHVGLQPPEDALPAFAVAGCTLGIVGEAFVTELDQGSGALLSRAAWGESVDGLGHEVPIDHGLGLTHIARPPGVDHAARGIDLDVFALDVKLGAVGADAVAAELASGARIRGALRDAVEAGLSPPASQ